MRIARFQFNMLPVNTYVLWDTASRECAIVDAGCYYPKEEETLAEFIDDNKLTVKYLLATHLHFDHCFGNSFVAKKYGVILYAAEADEFLLQNMVRQCESFGIPFRGEIQPIGHYISDKDTFDLGHEKLKAIAVPGLISDEPVAGKIVKSAAGKKFGTTEWTLSNGVKVILKPTDFKSDEISMQAVSKGGLSLYDYTDRALVKNLKAVNDVVELSGLGKYGRTDLMKALAGKTVSTYFSLGEPMEMINASCATKDLETMMQLVYLTFTDIHRDEDAFAAWKEQMKAVLTNYANDPQFIFSDSLSATLYNHNIMREPLKAEDIDLINYDRILEIAKERTANAADYTFIFVGNFDIDSLKPVVEKYIASLPANKNRDKVGKISTIQPGLIDNNFTLPMQTAKSTVYAIYSGKQKYDLRSNIMFSMLDQIMDIVYTETIREEEGGTYGVGTSSNLSPVNNSWLFLFGFDTNPQDEKRLTERAHAELNKVVTEGPREKDFNKVKEYMLKQHAQNLRENSYWTNIIKSDVLGYGDNNTDYENIVNGITLDDMKKFTKKLFNGKNIIEVTMTGVDEDETK